MGIVENHSKESRFWVSEHHQAWNQGSMECAGLIPRTETELQLVERTRNKKISCRLSLAFYVRCTWPPRLSSMSLSAISIFFGRKPISFNPISQMFCLYKHTSNIWWTSLEKSDLLYNICLIANFKRYLHLNCKYQYITMTKHWFVWSYHICREGSVINL